MVNEESWLNAGKMDLVNMLYCISELGQLCSKDGGRTDGLVVVSPAEGAQRNCFGLTASQTAEQSRVKLFSVCLIEEEKP